MPVRYETPPHLARIIRAACYDLGTSPLIDPYANAIAVAFRNGDGERVIVLIDKSDAKETIEVRIQAAFKVKAENLPSEATLAKLTSDEKLAHMRAQPVQVYDPDGDRKE